MKGEKKDFCLDNGNKTRFHDLKHKTKILKTKEGGKKQMELVKDLLAALRRIREGTARPIDCIVWMFIVGQVGITFAWGAYGFALWLDVPKNIGRLFFTPALICFVTACYFGRKAIAIMTRS